VIRDLARALVLLLALLILLAEVQQADEAAETISNSRGFTQ